MILCKGKCDKLPSLFRYDLGFQYCCICSLFLQGEKNRCPCCHGPLRTHRRQWGNHRDKNVVYI